MPESVQLPLEGKLVNQSKLERQVANLAKKAGRNLKVDLGTSSKDIKSLEQPLGRITGQADDFGKSMQAANARVIAFGASVGIINAVVQSFKALVSTTIEVESSLAKINSILKTTVSGLDQLKGQIFEIARNTEQTFDTVAEAALELSRQGLNATEVTKRLNDSLILARLSGITATEAVSGLTAAVNSFSKAGLTTGEVLNKISNAANQFAVSERDLIEGFKRSASVAQQAGVSIDELGGIITAVQQKTARGGAVIGNSFKTIFTRIGRAENLDLLESLGVQITDTQGKILPATKLIENLAGRLESLNDVQVRNITEKIGGGFQIAPLIAALSDYSSESSIAVQATEAFRTATDQAYQKNIILNQTLSAAISRTTSTIKELAAKLGELGVNDTFKELLGIVENFAAGINKVLDGEFLANKFTKGFIGGLSGALIKGGLAIFGVLLFELSKQLLKFGIDSFKTFIGLNKEAERLKSIQAQIVQTLLTDKGVREQILKIENSSLSSEGKKLQQAEFFNTALRERVALTSQLNKVSIGIGAGIAAQSKTSVVKRGAGGYFPIGAEQKDISKGVGGAPSGAKPVVIPNFAFGNGKSGTMVANSSEYIVPNYAGGGSAIFNQDMVKSMGLPSGAKKINAAGGYIPNFAKGYVNEGGRDFVLLTGSYGSDKADSSFYGVKDKKNETRIYDSVATAGQQGFSERLLTKIDVPTFQAKRPKGDAGGASYIDKLEAEIRDLGAEQAVKTAVGISNPINVRSESADKLKGRFQKGAVNSLAGSVFEVALASILDGAGFKDYESRTENSLIDLPKSDGLYTAFGVGAGQGKSGAEVKGSSGKELQKSAAKKFFDVLVGGKAAFGRKGNEVDLVGKKLLNEDAKKLGFLKKGRNGRYPNGTYTVRQGDLSRLEGQSFTSDKSGILKRSASGYIPNFAQNQSPLEEAIGRERQAGIPINQGRINQDGKLRNSQNPEGLAVTNTRDEPTGAVPKNAAGGFVPNFVGREMAASAVKANENAIRKQTEATKALTKGTQGQAVASEKAKTSGLAFAGSFFILQGALGGLTQEAEKGGQVLSALAQGASAALSAFFTLKTVGLGVGGPSGGIGRKGRNNFNASVKASEDGSFLKNRQKQLASGRASRGAKGAGALAGLGRIGIGKVALGFARFLPLIGIAVTAFTALNPLLKAFGIDILGGLGDIFKKVGQKIGLIDKPAEAAAKALQKLNESAIDAAIDPSKDSFSSLDSKIRSLELASKGFTDKKGEQLTSTQIIEKALGGGAGKEKDLRAQTQVNADAGLISLLTKKDKEALSQKPEDVRKYVDAQIKRLGTGDAGARQKLIDQEVVLKEKKENAKKGSSEEKDLTNKIKENLKLRNDIEKSLQSANKISDESFDIEKGRKRILGEIANIRIKSVIAQQKALAALKTEAEFALDLKKSSINTNAFEGLDIERESNELKIQRDLQQEISDIFTKRILGNKSVQNVLAPDATKNIDAKVYEDINDALLTGAEIQGKILDFTERRLSQVDGINGKEKEVVSVIQSQITAATKLALISKNNNDLQSARLKITQALAAQEKRVQELRDKSYQTEKTNQDNILNGRQRAIDLEKATLQSNRSGRQETTSDIRKSNAIDAKQTLLNNEKSQLADVRGLAQEFIKELRGYSDVINPSDRFELEGRLQKAQTFGDLKGPQGEKNKLIENSIKNAEKQGEVDKKAALARREALQKAITDGLKNGFGQDVELFGGNVARFGEYVDQILTKKNTEDLAVVKGRENKLLKDTGLDTKATGVELIAALKAELGKTGSKIDNTKNKVSVKSVELESLKPELAALNKYLEDNKRDLRRSQGTGKNPRFKGRYRFRRKTH